MDDDQQFCLRWNNHQSTLVSVFDNLLENGALVDCTLFAEGKYLKAHKVVLSACSPYFESLLTQQYDKHPIFILKDVKFQELKAMMDYMYRGEVNISQDQLAALLKAAESLQIKGLSDSRNKSDNESRKAAPPPPPKTPPPAPTLPRVQGLTIEQRKTPKLSSQSDMHHEDSMSRDGSISPVPRKRKKPRRRTSQDGLNDNHDASNSSESHSNQAPAQNIPSSSALPTGPLASTSKLTVTDVPEPDESKADIITTRQITKKEQSTHPPSTSSSTSDNITQVPIKEKLETHSELILEPKSEYIEDDMNEDSVEDLTLDDDDVSQMEHEMDHARPGPSHGSTDGSAQGFGAWHMSGNQNQDEVFLAAQEAVGAHRDSQAEDLTVGRGSNWNHWPSHLTVPMMLLRESMEMKPYSSFNMKIKGETSPLNKSGALSVQLATGFECPACGRLYKLKSSLRNHQKWECGKEPQFKCPFCVYKAKQKMHVARHMERMHKPKEIAAAAVAAAVKDEQN